MASLAPLLKQRFVDSDGNALAGGKVWSYAAGTTTPKATYTDETAAAANTNPIILNANGEADIWLASSYYKLVVMDSSDAVQYTVDRVSSVGASVDDGTYASGQIELPNNISTFTEIPGLILDTTVGKTYSIFFDVTRFVTGSELRQSGQIQFNYNSVTTAWDMIPLLQGDDAGFDVTAEAFVGVQQFKVKYKTTNVVGSSYLGTLKYKVKDIL